MCKGLLTRIRWIVLVVGAGLVPLIDQVLAEPNKAEKSASAKVSIVEAITTASEKVTGAVIEAKLEQKHDQLIWEVEVVTPEKQVMKIHIDAQTGAAIDVEEQTVKARRIQRRN